MTVKKLGLKATGKKKNKKLKKTRYCPIENTFKWKMSMLAISWQCRGK
jgi:hypothetical protein